MGRCWMAVAPAVACAFLKCRPFSLFLLVVVVEVMLDMDRWMGGREWIVMVFVV